MKLRVFFANEGCRKFFSATAYITYITAYIFGLPIVNRWVKTLNVAAAGKTVPVYLNSEKISPIPIYWLYDEKQSFEKNI